MPDLRNWYFYIVRCSDGCLYSGITLDLEERIHDHDAGSGSEYTSRRRPVTLVYSESYSTKSEARKREIQVKNWRSEKKEELIRGFPSTSSG